MESMPAEMKRQGSIDGNLKPGREAMKSREEDARETVKRSAGIQRSFELAGTVNHRHNKR